MNTPKFLVIGASGYLGRALLRAARQSHADAIGLTRAQISLERSELVGLGLEGMDYEWGVIAAAVPGLARCEAEPEATRLFNVEGTLKLARQLAEMGIRPLWFSSDQVFDGSASPYADTAPTSPVNAYGRQKAEVEARFAAASHGKGLVVRLSKVYDTTPGSGTLLDGMLANLRNGGMERASSDLIFCPTHLDDVVACVITLMRHNASGVVNVAGPPISRLHLARMAAEAVGVPSRQVLSVQVKDLKEPFCRPGRVELIPSPRLEGYAFLDLSRALERLYCLRLNI